MEARVGDRQKLILPLAVPSLGGLAYLYAYDAPERLLLINAGALAAALVWIMLGRLPTSRAARLSLAIAAVIALLLPLLIGPTVGGVSRWLQAGPMSLHSGTLLLPLIIVLAAGEAKLGPAVLALAGAALALQSDAAVLAALAAASAALAGTHRSALYAIVAAAGAVLAILTLGDATLEPQVFTESVLPQVAGRSLLQAMALATLMFAMPLWLLVLDPRTPRPECYALAALLITLGIMAILAPFPYPLVGYGASPILGVGLALGAPTDRRKTASDDDFFVTS